MSRFDELRSQIRALDDQLSKLAAKTMLTAAENRSWDTLRSERDKLYPQFEQLELRAASQKRIQERATGTYAGIPGGQHSREAFNEASGLAFRALDGHVDSGILS